jgi:hypothetical protein
MTQKASKYALGINYMVAPGENRQFELIVDPDMEDDFMLWFTSPNYGLDPMETNPIAIVDVKGQTWGLLKHRIVSCVTIPIPDASEDSSGTKG